MPVTAGGKIRAVIEIIIYQLKTNKRMKTNTLSTKLSRLLFCCLLCAVLISCSSKKPNIDRNNLKEILDNCKGHAVVVGKGYNAGNFEAYRHYLIIRDDSLNVYEYIGAEYSVSVGDTIK